MKKLLFILFIALPGTLLAQLQGQAKIDSLLKVLPKAINDTNKVKLLNSLAFTYYSVNPDEGIKYGEMGIELATKLGWKIGMARAKNNIGVDFMYKSDYDKALTYYMEAQNIYENEHNPAGIAMVNNNIGIVYMQQSNYPKALECYLKALKIDEEIGAKPDMVKLITNISTIYMSQGDFSKALEYDLKALKMEEEVGDKIIMASILGNIGDIYKEQSEYPKALDYYFKALKIDDEIGNKYSSGTTLTSIGMLYEIQKDYPKTLEYYFKALKIGEETGNKDLVAANTCNIGIIYSDLGDNAKALEYYFKALKMDEEMGNKSFISTVTGNIGDIYAIQKEYLKAIEYCQKALNMAEEIGEKHNVARQLSHIGIYYLLIVTDTSKQSPENMHITTEKKADLNNAIKYLEKSDALCKSIHVSDVLIDNYQNLAEAYKLLGNYKLALENTEAYTILKDSVFSTDNKVKLANLATQRETDLKEKQIELNKKQIIINKLAIVKTRNERIIFLAGAVMLIVVIIAMFKNYKTQKRINKIQEDALKQKEILMKEIHHRVKNNLQVISALLDLQLINVTDENAKEALTESTTRLKAISLMHHQLYRDDYVTTVECSQFATDLHAQVSTIFNKPGQKIVFQNYIPNITLDIDTTVPLGLILNELMTNSYKYAFDGKNGWIRCKMEREREGYKLTYTDSGPGLPSGLDIKKLKSLGMTMMHGLSKEIGGSFSYLADSKTFLITFRDAAEMKKIA